MSDTPDAGTITRLLAQAGAGDRLAYDQLIPLIYEELRAIAAVHLQGERPNHTLQATALVHEAYIRIAGLKEMSWRDRKHFFGVASGAIRRILVDHARKVKARKRGDGAKKVSLDSVQLMPERKDVNLLALDDALNELVKLDERQCKIVELRFFGGMTVPEVAKVLGISTRTIEGDWKMAKSWLRQRLRDDA